MPEKSLAAMHYEALTRRYFTASPPTGLNNAGGVLTCLYSTDAIRVGGQFAVQALGKRRMVELSVTPAGFVIYE